MSDHLEYLSRIRNICTSISFKIVLSRDLCNRIKQIFIFFTNGFVHLKYIILLNCFGASKLVAWFDSLYTWRCKLRFQKC